jgi:FkbM family methyltransferase
MAEAKELLSDAGYTVVPPKMAPSYLGSLNFGVKTVFDVGVNKGTPGLYKAFAGTTIVLVDPRAEAIDLTLRHAATKYGDTVFIGEICAAGSSEGSAILQIPDRGGRASIQNRAPLTAGKVTARYEVPVRRLDAIVAQRSLPGPFGIKQDTEGHEMEVLAGATGLVPHTEFIIAEVSVKRRFEGGYRFSDLMAFMHEHGFELLDTMTFKRRPSAWMDCLFVRADSPLFG